MNQRPGTSYGRTNSTREQQPTADGAGGVILLSQRQQGVAAPSSTGRRGGAHGWGTDSIALRHSDRHLAKMPLPQAPSLLNAQLASAQVRSWSTQMVEHGPNAGSQIQSASIGGVVGQADGSLEMAVGQSVGSEQSMHPRGSRSDGAANRPQ